MSNNIIKIVLLVVILVLAYLVYESLMKPVRFNNEVTARNKTVIQNLMDIRLAQITYKTINGRFTTSFDTLIDFLKKGEIPVVKIIPDPTDTTFTRTIRDTLGYIPVIDSLFKNRPGYKVDDIRYVPFSNKELFTMDAGVIDKGGVKVNVFEASAHYNLFLKGLDNQSVINLIASKEQIERYPGLKVGSMTEASTDGNWE
jgi:type II secretory pathway pseudopilin PulG